MPPPASTTLNTLGQWSRPASLLILGVRPNSLETMTIVRFNRPVRSRSRINAANAWSSGGVSSVFVANLGGLGGDVKGLARLLRADQAVRPLVEGVHRRDVVALLALG